MKKKGFATVGIVFGLALIALGLAPAAKSAYQSVCRIMQAEQLREGVGQKKAEEEVIDTLYLSSETAEPVVERATSDTEPDIEVVPLIPEWITAKYGPGDYYYHAEVADGDPEVVFSSFSEDAPDFIQVVSLDAPDESLQELSVDGIYELKILLGHNLDETTLENVGLSTTFCQLTGTRLRFMVEIDYGIGSKVVYAEEFSVASVGEDHSQVVGLGFVRIAAPSQRRTILTNQVFDRNLFKVKDSDEIGDGKITLDDALLPGGTENLYEITIPFGFVQLLFKSDSVCAVEPISSD